MKDYFISLEFWERQGTNHKFLFGTIKADLEKETVLDIAMELIKNNSHEIRANEDNVRVTAFNLV